MMMMMMMTMMMMMMMMTMMMMRMEAKSCANMSQNLLFYSLRYCSTYIGTPNVRVKVLWVYSYLKADFFLNQTLLNPS